MGIEITVMGCKAASKLFPNKILQNKFDIITYPVIFAGDVY